jgi:hypothetical protein
VVTKRTEGIFTTNIIVRIIYIYNLYLEKDIKGGFSEKDLNISKSKYLVFKINFY